jgi:seryl-tRNA synthetase
VFDIRWIRENPEEFDKALQLRGGEAASAPLIKLDDERREVIQAMQELQNQRNTISKEIGVKKSKGESADDLLEQAAKIREDLPQLEEQERELSEKLNDQLVYFPNRPAPDVPQGIDENDNVEVRRWGEPPVLEFEPKQHFELGEDLGMMDFETAAKMSGSRFVLLRKDFAKLERALASFMIDVHVQEYGYTEISPPYLVRPRAMYNTGQLPKFGDEAFSTTNDYWLVPTAEIPLTNIVADAIVEDLPHRYVAYTPCFRSEAGAAGKDTRGMIRLHQFSKVELVSVTAPENSEDEHQRMLSCAQSILEKLNITYRTVLLCTGDMGAAAQKTYDIEVWLPGQDAYREISSCSNCGEYQARRMGARMRVEEGGKKKTQFVHTLNGSGLAVGRTLIALIENYQQADGTIAIPDVLHSYMGGQERIAKE